MMPQLLYSIPVALGLLSIMLIIPVITVLRRIDNLSSFLLCSAYTDLLMSFSVVLSGLQLLAYFLFDYAKESIESSTMITSDPVAIFWIFTEFLQGIMIISFASNQLLQAILPYSVERYLNATNSSRLFFAALCVSLVLSLLPMTFQSEFITFSNSTMEGNQSAFEACLTGYHYMLGCIAFALITLAICITIIRFLRPAWSIVISKQCDNIFTMKAICFARCCLYIASEYQPIVLQSNEMRLIYVRIAYCISMAVLNPVLLLTLFPSFKKACQKPIDKYKAPKIAVTTSADPEEIKKNIRSRISRSEIWSTGEHYIGQIQFEHHETRAERERSISFYNIIRNDNDVMLQKLKETNDNRQMEKDMKKARASSDSNFLTVPNV